MKARALIDYAKLAATESDASSTTSSDDTSRKFEPDSPEHQTYPKKVAAAIKLYQGTIRRIGELEGLEKEARAHGLEEEAGKFGDLVKEFTKLNRLPDVPEGFYPA